MMSLKNVIKRAITGVYGLMGWYHLPQMAQEQRSRDRNMRLAAQALSIPFINPDREKKTG